MRLGEKLRQKYEAWQEPKPHPQTGDLLTPGEMITWRVMSVYRRWSVFFALQVLTVVWWTHGDWFPGGLAGWNYLWSDLAVIVEMMVGIAFLNQSLRDARIIRSLLKELREEHQVTRDLLMAHTEDVALIREVHAEVCGKEAGNARGPFAGPVPGS